MGMITGRQTLASIEEALQQVSAESNRLSAELDSATQEKARLIAERLTAFQELAKFRAKLATVDGVIDEADQLSAQVTTILQARQKTLNALQKREADANSTRERILAEQKLLDKDVEQLEKKLDALGEAARKALAADPAYNSHAKLYADSRGVVEKANEKAAKSRAEEAEKGAPYRNDPLFLYLWERKFATSDYPHRGLVRWLDGWVARLIGYQEARLNFNMLTAIPQRLAEHAARMAQIMKAEKDALDAIEGAKIRELADDDLPQKLRAAHASREKQTADMQALNAELQETGAQLKIYAEGQDQSFRAAIDGTTKFLEGVNLGSLLRDARRTPDVQDDEIVALIGRLADGVNAVEQDAQSKRAALDAAFARKQELLRIASEFRRARYDQPGSVFDAPSGSNTQQWLQLLLQGAITAADYWIRTQNSQRWRNRPGDGYRRSDFPSSRGSDWFGGGSSGGGSSGRNDSGPDFRTGGGF